VGSATIAVSVRARVDSKGRVLIPKSLRELAGIREGDEVLVSVEGGKVVIEKAGDPWRELAELLGDLTFDRSLRRLAEDAAKKEIREKFAS
jgi:AbrB family looped-hinge helix DNA binding protein